MTRMLRLTTIPVSLALATPAFADDWAQPVVNLQQSLAALGISLGGGVTGFGQGLAGGDGESGVPFGGKADLLLGLDAGKLGLCPGLSVSTHLEQDFGQSANQQGGGAILPVNTALAFPTQGGTTTDLSLIVTQKFGDAVSISLGKFNMLDVAARTPLIGGGGEATFWNIGLAAPVSGVTPPYIFCGIATVNTAPATLTLMVYDPRNAQDPDVISHPFSQGTTTSLSAKVQTSFFGLTGYQTVRGVTSTAEGFNFDDPPQLLLPPGLQTTKLTKQGYAFGSWAVQQFLWQDPENPGKGWGFFGQISASDANPNPIGNTIIAGVGGSTPTRPDDRWGVVWCDYLFSRALASGLGAFGGGLDDERVLEAYYDAAVAPHVRFGPDAQVIWPGTPGYSTALFLGLRGRVTF
jgi:porin